jgi:hypothetical protein
MAQHEPRAARQASASVRRDGSAPDIALITSQRVVTRNLEVARTEALAREGSKQRRFPAMLLLQLHTNSTPSHDGSGAGVSRCRQGAPGRARQVSAGATCQRMDDRCQQVPARCQQIRGEMPATRRKVKSSRGQMPSSRGQLT